MALRLSIPALALIVAAFVCQETKGQRIVPSSDFGFVYPRDTTVKPKIRMAAYMDLGCTDSMNAFPNLVQLAKHYGDDMEMKIYLFALSFHRNSHMLHEAAYVMDSYFKANNANASVYDWFTIIYDNVADFYNRNTANMVDADIDDKAYAFASQISTISKQDFLDEVHNSTTRTKVIAEWKYGCTRAVYATPTFSVNDVVVAADPATPFSNWQPYLDRIMQSAF